MSSDQIFVGSRQEKKQGFGYSLPYMIDFQIMKMEMFIRVSNLGHIDALGYFCTPLHPCFQINCFELG